MISSSFSVFLQEHVHLKQPEEADGAAVGAFLRRPVVAPGCLVRTLTLAGWLPELPHPRPQMADTQQFFTGKLYVPVHMLKLPAEELLWSALHRMTQEEEAGGGGGAEGGRGRRGGGVSHAQQSDWT